MTHTPELIAGARAAYELFPRYRTEWKRGVRVNGRPVPWEDLSPGYRKKRCQAFAAGLAALTVTNEMRDAFFNQIADDDEDVRFAELAFRAAIKHVTGAGHV